MPVYGGSCQVRLVLCGSTYNKWYLYLPILSGAKYESKENKEGPQELIWLALLNSQCPPWLLVVAWRCWWTSGKLWVVLCGVLQHLGHWDAGLTSWYSCWRPYGTPRHHGEKRVWQGRWETSVLVCEYCHQLMDSLPHCLVAATKIAQVWRKLVFTCLTHIRH